MIETARYACGNLFSWRMLGDAVGLSVEILQSRRQQILRYSHAAPQPRDNITATPRMLLGEGMAGVLVIGLRQIRE